MKPFDFSVRPFIIIWETTQACSLVCRHCRASAELRRHPLELGTEEAFRFIDQVAACEPALFVLTGGDPVRRTDLLEIIRYATGKGLRVGLTPSATPELVQVDFAGLKAAGVARLALSLDGASRASHDTFRGVPGTWDLTHAAIAKAREAGLPLQINTTFTRTNLGEFDAFVSLLREIRPELWSVFQLVPTGRGKTGDLLSAEEMEELFLRLQRLAAEAPFDIKTTEGHHYRRVVVQQTRNTASLQLRSPLGINDGKGFLFVSHIGEIYPSGFLPLRTGNVRTDNLLAVYRDNPIFRQLRDSEALGGKCGLCEFRKLCGGSRARAYAMTGDYMAEEPLCLYQPRRAGEPDASIPVNARARSVEPVAPSPVSIL
ncbi:MAG TPA: radical SAM/SPASM domain-containing protein [Verrucomicrobiales bacterium]|nr:radical SAM/SPASM domain-containing protein [Verrucomicrobiales bacterium]